MNITVDKIYQVLSQASSALSFDELLTKTQLNNFELMNSLGTLSCDGKVCVSQNDGKLFFTVV